jgi:hypothetical protein
VPDKADIASRGTSLGSVSGAVTGKGVELSAGAKDIYVVVKDAAGNISSPMKIEASAYATSDTTAPVLSNGSSSRISEITGSINFTTNEAGTAYYTVEDKDAAAPDKADIESSGTSLGSVSGTVTNKTVDLTAGAKDIYVVVKDTEDNISDPLKIEVEAYVPPATEVTTAAELKTELEKTVPDIITVGQDITLNQPIKVMASHTLIVPSGKTLTNSGLSGMDLGTHMLTVKGGGTLNSETADCNLFVAGNGILNLENITINLKNTHNGGLSLYTVNMNTGAVINIDSETGSNLLQAYNLVVNSGATLNIKNFRNDAVPLAGGSKLHINGGSVYVSRGAATGNHIGINNMGTLKFTLGTLTGTNGGAIYLETNSVVEGMSDILKDRGIVLNNPLEINVIPESTGRPPSANWPTSGKYLWDGEHFAKPIPVTWTDLTANGTANTEDTSALTLVFSDVPTSLTLADITVTGATKGSLSGTGTTRTLAISNITVADGVDVTVEITHADILGITPSFKTVAVHRAAIVSDIIPPVLSAGSVDRTSDMAATISFATDEAGEAYYVVVKRGTSPAPTKGEVTMGISLGSVSKTVANKAVTLTTGAKDIYVVVKDAAGNISDPLKIEAMDCTSPKTEVATVAELKAALATIAPTTITLTQDIILEEAVEAKADHCLTVLTGKMLSTAAQGSINLAGHTLTVKGGGTLNSETYDSNLFWVET